MVKKMSLSMVVIGVLCLFCASFVRAEAREWCKSATLPNGDVVLDMKGDWDVLIHGYGYADSIKDIKDVLTIKQEGDRFSACIRKGINWWPSGSETIKGVVNKDGFKQVLMFTEAEGGGGAMSWERCLWEIVDNGKTVALDCGGMWEVNFTRK